MKHKIRHKTSFLRYAAVAVVVVIAGGVVWIVVKQIHKNTIPANVPVGQVDQKCNAAYHDVTLCKFEAAQAAAPLTQQSYSATITTTENGKTIIYAYKQDGKGNKSITSSDGSLAVITLNGVTHLKTATGWATYPSNRAPGEINPSSNLGFLNTITQTNFTKAGSATCGNLTCVKYLVKLPHQSQTPNYIYFDTNNYLLREYSATSNHGSVDMQFTYLPVTITAP